MKKKRISKRKNKKHDMKIMSLNVQGINQKEKQVMLADEYVSRKITVALIQETKIQEQEQYEITATNGKKLVIYNSGHNSMSLKGVAIMTTKETAIAYKAVDERICMAEIRPCKVARKKLVVLSVYAPTEDETKENPDKTDDFYSKLGSVIQSISKRDCLVIGGDFNARTKLEDQHEIDKFSEIVGKYARSKVNTNGRKLLEFAKMHKLQITNTFYKHKASQLVTWESALPPQKERKNPYRFQIDYILVRHNKESNRISDCRAYNKFGVTTDHKPLILKIKSHHSLSRPKPATEKLNLLELNNAEKKEEYQEKVRREYQTTGFDNLNWKLATDTMMKAAKETVGIIKRNGESTNCLIQELSKEQKEVKNKIDSSRNSKERIMLRVERNKILTRLHAEMKKEEKEKIHRTMEPLMNDNNDSRNMFNVMKELKRSKPQRKLVMKNKDGMLVTDEVENCQIIAEHFKEIFFKGAEQYPNIQPQPMKVPFTKEEVAKSLNKMKNGKSTTDIAVELIKHAPSEVHDGIAKILNRVASTGEYPEEIVAGVLCAIEKSKAKEKLGLAINLRPIILFAALRKILSVMMMGRVKQKMQTKVPISQAAYTSGRSTTEHVFTIKMVAERTVNTENEEVHLILLDMSKAFDTINRKILLQELSEIIDEDELHIMQIMLNVNLRVRCGSEYSDSFQTDTGGPQGDSSSANEFIFYLAKALSKYYTERRSSYVLTEHN